MARNKSRGGGYICCTTRVGVNLNFVLSFVLLVQEMIMHLLHRKCINWETRCAVLYKHPLMGSNVQALQLLVMKSNHPALTQHLSSCILQPPCPFRCTYSRSRTCAHHSYHPAYSSQSGRTSHMLVAHNTLQQFSQALLLYPAVQVHIARDGPAKPARAALRPLHSCFALCL